MYCNYCRSLNPNDATYCRACGRTVSLDLNTLENQTQAGETAEPPVVAPSSAPSQQRDGQTTSNIESRKVNDTQRNPTEQKQQAEYLPTLVAETVHVAESEFLSSQTSPGPSSLVPVYGTMGHRFTAYFADFIVIYFIAVIFYVVAFALKLPVTANEGESQLVWLGTLFVYMVVAQAAYHTTIGKYVHGLEVCSAKPNRKYPALWRILLRETLGRFFSSFFWGLGYWMAFRKSKTQAWSDELAGTVVTLRPTSRVLVRAFTAFILVAFCLDVGLTTYGLYKEDKDKKYAAFSQEMGVASDAVIAARKDVDNRLNSAPTVNTWADFAVWQEVMKFLKKDLDVYESRMDHIQALIQRGISEDITASEAERRQFVILHQVYELRKQQAEKLHQEANLIVNCAPTQSSYAGLRTDLQLMDSDIKGLESQVSQLMTEINAK